MEAVEGVKPTFPAPPADGIMAGAVVRFCHDVSRTGRMGGMTDRRNDEQERTEEADKRQEERDRRSDELRESWRRNHPSEEEERKGRTGRGRRGRPA